MTHEQANRRALVLLAIGSIVGICLGATAAVQRDHPAPSRLPDDAMAVVNGVPIREEDYARAVTMFASGKRNDITDDDRLHVLNRLIEEELLIQQGIQTGLVDSDRAVRKALTRAMLDAILAESASERPSEDTLRAFYKAHASLFVRSTLLAHSEVKTEENTQTLPAFETVREQVEAVYAQRTKNDAFREYIEWLRTEAKIALASETVQ